MNIDYKQFYEDIKSSAEIDEIKFCGFNCDYYDPNVYESSACSLFGSRLREAKDQRNYRCKKCKQYFGEQT
jgi:hypothetical protein